ncbi:Alpha/Beta hydrolase protein [Gongronella butleri]|nr:Alpha/Beta hydrolase protein [Gongronella butleri]
MEKQQVQEPLLVNLPNSPPSSPPKRRVRAVLSAAIVACAFTYFFGSGFSVGDSHSSNPVVDIGYTEGNFTWTKCYEKYECSKFTVPVDYSDPDSATFDLALIRLKATQKVSKGPLFVNPGGPGGSGVDLVKGAGDVISKHVNGHYDILGFDPRGVGSSKTIQCFKDGTESKFFLANRRFFMNYGDSIVNHASWQADLVAQCIDKNKDFVPYVSTAAVARDIDAMREAFGQELTNYWGFSYGTFLGATYVNMFPDRVGRVILDGVTDPSTFSGELVNWIKTSLIHTEDGLDGFGAYCEAAGPEKCALANREKALAFEGDRFVAPTLRHYLDYLVDHPIKTKNLTASGTVMQADVATALFASLYNVAKWPRIAEIFEEAIATSYGDKFLSFLQETQDDSCPLVEPYFLSATPILCIDGTHQDQPDIESYWAAIQDAMPISPLSVHNWGSGMVQCLYWNVTAAERYAGPWNHKTKNKVLLIGATMDPVTPVESAAKLEDLMEGSGVFHKHEGYGHCSVGQPSKCTSKVIHDYLVDGKVPEKGSECPMEVAPFETDASLQLLDKNDLNSHDLTILAESVFKAQRVGGSLL